MKTVKAEGFPSLTYEAVDETHVVGLLKKGQQAKLLPTAYDDAMDCRYLSTARKLLRAPSIAALDITVVRKRGNVGLLFAIRYKDRVAVIAKRVGAKRRMETGEDWD